MFSLEVTILLPNTGEIWIKSLLSWVQISDAEIVSKKIADIPTANSFFHRVPKLTQNMATQHAHGFEWVLER